VKKKEYNVIFGVPGDDTTYSDCITHARNRLDAVLQVAYFLNTRIIEATDGTYVDIEDVRVLKCKVVNDE